jgi:hypothetical protein
MDCKCLLHQVLIKDFNARRRNYQEDEGNYTYLRNSIFVFFTQYCCSEYIKEAEIGQTCSKHGVMRCAYNVLRKTKQ